MHQAGYLPEVLVILTSAVVFVLLFQRFRASPILGYLIAGLVIGPYGLGLIQDAGTIRLLAEFGIIFLLFTVGLGLPFDRISAMRWYIFGLGFAQVILCTYFVTIVAMRAGIDITSSFIIGGALSLSSTAVVIQLLIERRENASRFGRISLAILLFQDLAVVPLLAIIPLLGGKHVSLMQATGIAFLEAGVAILVIYYSGKYLIQPLYRYLAVVRNPELFSAATLLTVLAISWATYLIGMSTALGAFFAGLMFAETEYRHQVEADIQPFRNIFLGLFFISIGMFINIHFVVDNLWIIAGMLILFVSGKAVVTTVICHAFGLSSPVSVRIGMMLAQGCEFAFVIIGIAVLQGIIPDTTGQILYTLIALSIVTTPLCADAGKALASLLERQFGSQTGNMHKEADDLSHHIIIAGYGRTGQIIGALLTMYHIPFVAVDLDVNLVMKGRKRSHPVYFGDASRLDILRSAGVKRAKAVMVTIQDMEASERLVRLLRQHYPDLDIFARGHDELHGERLQVLGASVMIPEIKEPSLQLGANLLSKLGQPPSGIEQILSEYRKKDIDFLDGDVGMDIRPENEMSS